MLRPMSETGSELSQKKWGVGVELAANHLGPIHFATALSEGRDGDLDIGIHVLPDQELLHPLVTPEEAKEIRKRVQKDVGEIMAREGLSGERVRVELTEDDEIERGLVEAAERLGLDGLIIGRRAKRDEDPIVRLGEVTRRVLRRLPVPVIVVPPDFGDEDDRGFGEGPVILASDLSDACLPAAAFAKDLAARLGRPLLLAHGTQAFHWGVSYIPAPAMEQLQDRTRKDAGKELGEWAAKVGIEDAETHVFLGDPVKNLLELAEERDAAVLVTGSRKLGPVERIFLASVSSEMAAAASCPVAIVGQD